MQLCICQSTVFRAKEFLKGDNPPPSWEKNLKGMKVFDPKMQSFKGKINNYDLELASPFFYKMISSEIGASDIRL